MPTSFTLPGSLSLVNLRWLSTQGKQSGPKPGAVPTTGVAMAAPSGLCAGTRITPRCPRVLFGTNSLGSSKEPGKAESGATRAVNVVVVPVWLSVLLSEPCCLSEEPRIRSIPNRMGSWLGLDDCSGLGLWPLSIFPVSTPFEGWGNKAKSHETQRNWDQLLSLSVHFFFSCGFLSVLFPKFRHIPSHLYWTLLRWAYFCQTVAFSPRIMPKTQSSVFIGRIRQTLAPLLVNISWQK